MGMQIPPVDDHGFKGIGPNLQKADVLREVDTVIENTCVSMASAKGKSQRGDFHPLRMHPNPISL